MTKIFVVMLIAFLGAVAWQYYPDYAYTQSSASNTDTDYDYGEFYGRSYPAPKVATTTLAATVLGTHDADKRIEIDLTNQKLYMMENGQKIREFLISSGKFGRTPTGTFSIWYKIVSTRMTGGSKALRTYYDLPRVPYTMFFYNDQIPKSRGYGIHGAYWHNNFGHPMSHGCINMRPDDAKVVFEWANPPLPEGKRVLTVGIDTPSTPVVIYGTAPKN